LQFGVVGLFAPWLPAAYRQLTTWPRVEGSIDFVAALRTIGQWFVVGPAAPSALGNVAVLVLVLVTLSPGRKRSPLTLPPEGGRLDLGTLTASLAPVVWLVLPVVGILGLGLFKEAYLKFLLIASPAFCLLAGRCLALLVRRDQSRESHLPAVLFGTGALLALFLLFASAFGLQHYYYDPAYARDDYRNIAAYVSALGRPGDAVVVNAPGQQEALSYYYHGTLPVYPLPQSRPLDPAATESALQALAQPGGRIFAVLWATAESDPDRLVEGWLDSHAYKALDSWYGNVRLAVYAVPDEAPVAPDRALSDRLQGAGTGDEIELLGYSLLNDRLAAGDIAQITLFWQSERVPARRYKVFLHLLDEDNHIVGQRDTEPGGGVRLTTLWQPGEVIADNYGLPIHPGTPPGQYRIEVGMYDLETGQRLAMPDGAEQVWLEPITVERPLAPAPVLALGMQHAAGAEFDDLALLGYDQYRLGFAHPSDAPLRPGDILHINLYWQARAQPSGNWQVAVDLVASDAHVQVGLVAPLVTGYPTSQWQAGDVWRGQFDLALPGDLPPGRCRLRVQPIAPDGIAPKPFLSESLSVAR
jgi:mannosyltransferase